VRTPDRLGQLTTALADTATLIDRARLPVLGHLHPLPKSDIADTWAGSHSTTHPLAN
jgi:hypothetical protein